MERKLGRIKDSLDPRDHIKRYSVHMAPRLPSSVNLSKFASKIEDQLTLGSCTAQSVVSLLEYNDNRFGKEPGYKDCSRLYQYYNTRRLENTVEFDSGASIRNAVKAAAKFGTCPESYWSYDISKYKFLPPQRCYKYGMSHRITSYERIDDTIPGTIDRLRLSLASGHPVVFGFEVFQQFMSDEMAESGRLKMPNPTETPLGGHAVVLMGYDDTTHNGLFYVRNSWGENWGLKGYFHMPYEFVGNSAYCSDFWTISSVVE
jgi:C1A family cysteine protease